MTISKSFAESLGGDLTVSSIPGKGSTFTVVIDAGEIDIGFVTGIDAGTRFRAKSDRALPNLRAVARLWTLRYTYLARAAFSMKNYVGFRGRRIGLVVRNNSTMTELNRVSMSV